MKKKRFKKELEDLEFELAKLQETVSRKGLKLAIVFEGRDAAGKGGAIKTIMRRMNARIWRIAALPKPSDRERTQWYFERYVAHLPAGGEIVLFDRSWYNRAVIEPVMGFCSPEEHETFMREVPMFEKMLIDSGLILIKFWIHVSPEEQEARFQDRATDPRKRWKLSPIDLKARDLWIEFTRYRDKMFERTSTQDAPWLVVDGNDKEKARLNIIRAILDRVPYEFNKDAFDPITLPPRPKIEDSDYKEPALDALNCVKDYYPDS
ncbi:polyphosphate kinase 2 [Hyphococcus flavus]|uniref:ADP/GDP-polyphosphate phosphotransferase n=1 Tax=Hyphococcus flavus TaxID=1866326 RepID=A0AAE9ZK33_9PROT|nr:polyphosphate kinase 2 [Hyphococcus flavus]WDI32601.1 polyphosphate kinase 2 [Hyphococcus flavus]